jgi:hypothetical protein
MVLSHSVRGTDAYGASTNSGQNQRTIPAVPREMMLLGQRLGRKRSGVCPAFDCGGSS